MASVLQDLDCFFIQDKSENSLSSAYALISNANYKIVFEHLMVQLKCTLGTEKLILCIDLLDFLLKLHGPNSFYVGGDNSCLVCSFNLSMHEIYFLQFLLL